MIFQVLPSSIVFKKISMVINAITEHETNAEKFLGMTIVYKLKIINCLLHFKCYSKPKRQYLFNRQL